MLGICLSLLSYLILLDQEERSKEIQFLLKNKITLGKTPEEWPCHIQDAPKNKGGPGM